MTLNSSKTIDIAELRIGMFVTGLEVPWSATEFPLQGTLIRNRQDILKISNYGRKVTVDLKRCSPYSMPPVRLPLVQKTRTDTKINVHKQVQRPWRKFCNQDYPLSRPLAKELAQAQQLLSRVDSAFDELKQMTQQITPQKVDELKLISQEMVSSLLDNPDALLWLTKVKASHGRVYDHTMRSAILATLMGRSMGLRRSSINALVQALLLSSIGKAHLNKNIWKKYKVQAMQPDFALCGSITITKLAHCKNIEPQVRSIIANMNERFDGSGFPNQKANKQIPYLSQIAGLVESFDLILHPMLSTTKLAFGEALSKLYCLADSLFDGALVEEFIQATGLYPAGTQVILSNGFAGTVVEQSKSHRIRATVALTHDPDGYRLLKYQVVQLGKGEFKDIIINKETNKFPLNDADVENINKLIRKRQFKLSELMSGVSRYLH